MLVACTALGGCLSVIEQNITRLASDTGAFGNPSVPQGYTRNFSPAPHNFRYGLRTAGDPVRYGDRSERFELRNGDCGGSDCLEPRSRAEIRMTDDINPARVGQDTWYSYSFYNATVPSFTKENSLRLVFGQWTVGGDNRPVFRFLQLGTDEGDFDACDPSICAETGAASGDLVVHLSDIANARGWGSAQNDGYVCRLFDMQAKRGTWVDITVNTNFGTGPDGYLRVWVDDTLKCDYSGPLVSPQTAGSSTTPHHRRGVFSTWHKRWDKATNNAPKPNLIVYYDEFRAGRSHFETDIRFSIASGSQPVD
ncbi:heparin lyase I family protein [Tateyamaria sp. syn59]|uniref:heparin lyase I family protein n=1 Tax=Tateyamaria sp. syn59 TaxID=2576942 RepID=UPI0016781F64|nr:heparin lyase I family protein [Tateyamaria sp. syn59]